MNFVRNCRPQRRLTWWSCGFSRIPLGIPGTAPDPRRESCSWSASPATSRALSASARAGEDCRRGARRRYLHPPPQPLNKILYVSIRVRLELQRVMRLRVFDDFLRPGEAADEIARPSVVDDAVARRPASSVPAAASAGPRPAGRNRALHSQTGAGRSRRARPAGRRGGTSATSRSAVNRAGSLSGTGNVRFGAVSRAQPRPNARPATAPPASKNPDITERRRPSNPADIFPRRPPTCRPRICRPRTSSSPRPLSSICSRNSATSVSSRRKPGASPRSCVVEAGTAAVEEEDLVARLGQPPAGMHVPAAVALDAVDADDAGFRRAGRGG